jgi:hypothetical protein
MLVEWRATSGGSARESGLVCTRHHGSFARTRETKRRIPNYTTPTKMPKPPKYQAAWAKYAGSLQGGSTKIAGVGVNITHRLEVDRAVSRLVAESNRDQDYRGAPPARIATSKDWWAVGALCCPYSASPDQAEVTRHRVL